MLWGTTGTAQALAPTGASSASIGAVRLLIGAIALVLLALVQRSIKPGVRWLWGWLIVGGVAVAAYQLTFFYGIALTGVAVGTVVGIGSAPVFGGIAGIVFNGERLTRRWMLASVLAILGATILTFAGPADVSAVNAIGVLLALGAGASYATYASASKKLIINQNPSAVMAAMFSIGAVLLLPVFFSSDVTWLATGRGMAVALHLGIMTVGLSYFLFANGMLTLSVSAATTLSLAEPLTATLLGILLLREQITVQAAVGIALLSAGLAVLALPQRQSGGAFTEHQPRTTK